MECWYWLLPSCLFEYRHALVERDDTLEEEMLWLLYRMRQRVDTHGLDAAKQLLFFDMECYCTHIRSDDMVLALRSTRRCKEIVPEFYRPQ